MIYFMFEQSGTFKNEAVKLGLKAKDLDIQNEFGQTDIEIDLYKEIEEAYDNNKSIFDKITRDDLVMAFFPCTRFENQFQLFLRGEAYQEQNYTDIEKLEYARKLFSESNTNYQIISKLFIVCLRKGFKLIVENPYSAQHFLVRYFPIKSKIQHMDRTLYGDHYKKPTQYWFVNCEPKHNFFLEDISYTGKIKTVSDSTRNPTERSMISPAYANRFIREFIL